MKKAVIVLDDWKLPIFKKTLESEGYKYSKHPGLSKGTLILKVETDNLAKLAGIVKGMNGEAARSRMN